MFIAKPLAMIRRKPLYFNVFLSLYDTMIFDRQLAGPHSMVAKLLYHLDKISCVLADKVFLDTQAHIDYFVTTFKLQREKFWCVFIGTDEELFYPSSSTECAKLSPTTFIVLFYGQFIPLHGSEYIIKTAHLLQKESDIAFTFMGAGQEYEAMQRMAHDLHLKNITWTGWVPHGKIRSCICGADICLGIFGDTDKASRVIPNKAFEIIAAKKPLLTGDSPASRELFTDRNDVLFCKMADPESLAEMILLLKNDDSLRNRIAEEGYKTFKQRCSAALVAQEVIRMIGT
jgi:glycosyltransferase involved in cell wall biosynthesis